MSRSKDDYLRSVDSYKGKSAVLIYPPEKEHDGCLYTWRRISCSHLSNIERIWRNGGNYGGGSAVLINPSKDKLGGMLVQTSRRISCSHLSNRERTWKNDGKHGGGSAVLTYPTEDEHEKMIVNMGEDQLFSHIHQMTNMEKLVNM